MIRLAVLVLDWFIMKDWLIVKDFWIVGEEIRRSWLILWRISDQRSVGKCRQLEEVADKRSLVVKLL